MQPTNIKQATPASVRAAEESNFCVGGIGGTVLPGNKLCVGWNEECSLHAIMKDDHEASELDNDPIFAVFIQLDHVS